MGIALTYLRPFVPQRAEYIRRSPYGHAYLVAPWRPDVEPWELEIESVLEDIRREHGIPYRVRYVADPIAVQPDPSVPVEPSMDVYRELTARGEGLSGRRRTTFDRDLRDSRGQVSPSAMLLVDIDGVLRWYEGPWYGWHTRVIQFLDGLLRAGPAYVEAKLRLPATYEIPPTETLDFIERQGDTPLEGRLLRALVESGQLGAGEPEPQVPVGRRIRWGKHGVARLPREGLKFVDLVHTAGPDTVWIVEAKETLNWQALGQALGYASLYQEDYLPKDHSLEIRPAITCQVIDETVLHCADLRGVLVFHDGEPAV